MAKELRFDVTALDRASQTFARLGQAVERFEKRLDRLDGKRVDAEVGVKTEQAEREVGAFATKTRRTLQAALTSLPEVEITVDSSAADRTVADLRRRMAELSDKTVGVDISAEAAIAESQALQRELDRLSRTSPNIQVRADAAAAAAKLAEVSREVERIDGRTATVKIKADSSVSNTVVQVAQLGRALAGLSVPAGLVAGLPQIASLGASATQAAGALGLIPAAGTAGALAVTALAVGFRGFADALGDNPKKAAEALAQMAPAGRDAVAAVRGLGPAWNELRLDVQSRMLAGLGSSVRQLGGTYMPILRGGLTGIAGGFNNAAGQVAAFMARASTVGDWRGIVTETSGAVTNLSRAFAPLTSVFTDLAAVGAPILRQLSQGATDAATRFAEFVSRARESGQLGAWMQRGVDVLRQLGTVAANVGSSLASIFRAANTGATPFLTTLEQATTRMAAFLRSAEGQSRIADLFNDIRGSVAALAPLFSALATAAANVAPHMHSIGLAMLALRAGSSVVGVIALLAAAFPPLISALSELAPLIPIVAGALIGLRVASTLGPAFTTAAGGVSTFLGSVRNAGSVSGGFKAALGGITSALGGPFGIALAGAGVALGLLATKQQDAARKAQEHKAALDSITGTLDSYTGAATQATSAEIAKQLAQDGSLDKLRALKVDTATYTDAMTGNAAAIETVTGQLHSQTVAAIGASGGYQQLKPALDAAGISLDDVALAAEGNVDAYNRINQAVEVASAGSIENLAANRMARDGMIDAGGAASQLQGRLNETVSALEKQRNALQSAAAAASDFGRELETVKPGFAALAQGASITPELQGHFDRLADSARKNAEAVGQNAIKFGNVSTAGQAASQAMQQSRDQFIQSATAAGMTEQAAVDLADRLGLIPAKVRTDFENNAEQTILQLRTVSDMIRAVPPGKAVVVDVLTGPARQTLSALGVEVRTLPNGKVEVTAKTEQAKASLDAFMRGASEKRAEVVIDGRPQPAQQALAEVLRQVSAGKGQVNIDGNIVPAQQAVSFLMGTVGGLKGDVQIGANRAPADQVLAAYLAAVRSGSGVVTINGNRVPADQVLAGLIANIQTPTDKPIGADTGPAQLAHQGLVAAIRAPETKPIEGNNTAGLSATELLNGAIQAPATKPIEGNNAGGMAQNQGLVGAVQAPATKPIEGNNAGGMAQNQGLVGVVQAPATKPINASDGAARGVVSSFIGWVAGLVATVTVVANKIGFAEGGIMPMADGGVIPMAAGGGPAMPRTWGGNRLNPMNTTAQIVRPRTWRVVGDRAQGDEAYIPLVPSSGRSRSILAVSAARMGFDLVPAGSVTTAASLRGPEVAGSIPQLGEVRARVQAAQASRAAAPSLTVRTGMDVAQLRAIRDELVGLRTDVLWAGHSPDVVSAIHQLAASAVDRIPDAAARASAARTLSALGLHGVS